MPYDVYVMLLDSFTEYWLCKIAIDDCDAVVFNDKSTIKKMNKGCSMCPRVQIIGHIR